LSDPSELTIEIHAGPRERLGRPVRVPVPWPEDTLVQLMRKDLKRPLPCQLHREQGKVWAYWILDHLKPGQRQIYRLVTGARQRKRRARVRIDRLGPDRVHVVNGRRQLAVLHLGRRWPLPFWNPVRTPDGYAITADLIPPPAGRIDTPLPSGGFWLAPPGFPSPSHGIELLGPARWTSGPVFGELELLQRWRLNHTDYVNATVRYRFFDRRDRQYLVDVSCELSAAYGPVQGNCSQSSGLLSLVLAPPLVSDASRIHSTFGAATASELQQIPVPWVDLSGLLGGRWAGVAVFLTGNTWTTRWRLNPESGLLTVGGLGEAGSPWLQLETGECWRFTARLWVHGGRPDFAEIADRYADYIYPPAVRIV